MTKPTIKKYHQASWIVLCVLSLFVLTAAAGCQPNSNPPSNTNNNIPANRAPVADGYIVVLVDGSTENDLNSVISSLSSRPPVLYHTVFKGFAGSLTASEIARLQNDPRIKSIERDQELFLDDPIEAVN